MLERQDPSIEEMLTVPITCAVMAPNAVDPGESKSCLRVTAALIGSRCSGGFSAHRQLRHGPGADKRYAGFLKHHPLAVALVLLLFVALATGGHLYWHYAQRSELSYDSPIVAQQFGTESKFPESIVGGDVISASPTIREQHEVSAAARDPGPSPSMTPAGSEPFGLGATAIESGEILAKWSGVETDLRAEHDILARCRDDASSCPPAAQKFLAVIAEGRSHHGRARIGVINRAINLAIRPTSDLVQWGISDRWSSPLATLASGRGDCEDYAIAKYVALREAGLAAQDVRLVVVHDLRTHEDHAVVTARLEGQWIVLDNRHLALVPDADLRRVVPLFVLDDEGARKFVPMMIADARRTTASSH
jgi:predicted transglutaminase-like cysteine proteinase